MFRPRFPHLPLRPLLHLPAAIVALAALAALAPSPAAAGERVIGEVDSFHGSFTHSIAITVPEFRKLEPKISLSYDSGGGNSVAGIGWSLAGISTIERASSRKGAPRYDAADIFLLDGQELVPCASAPSSPSCTAGGTHATKLESYHRIKRDAATDTWTVTQKDGITTTFTPIIATDRGTFRWGQTSVRDPMGTSASYSWTCPSGGPCYPLQISYADNVRVSFFLEPRPDVENLSTGRGLLRTAHRLRSVIVWIEGVGHIRGYQLAYDLGTTGRSRLRSVTEFGTDLVHTAGQITAGTSLPPTRFTYQNDPAPAHFTLSPTNAAPATEAAAWTSQVCTAVDAIGLYKPETGTCATTWDAGASATRGLALGDGYMEFTDGCRHWIHGDLAAGLSSTGMVDVSPVHTSLANLDFGVLLTQDPQTLETSVQVVERGIVKGAFGSFNHFADEVFRVAVSGGVVRYYRNGALFYTSTQPPTYPLRPASALYTEGIAGIKNVMVSGALYDLTGGCGNGRRFTGDYDGDGRTDELCAEGGTIRVRRGNGVDFDPPITWATNSPPEDFGQGDFNGDGKDDLWQMQLFSGAFSVSLSTGTAFSAPQPWGGASCRIDRNFQIETGDFNGDGRSDVACLRDAGDSQDGIWVGVSSGTAFTFSQWIGDACHIWDDNGVADFNGDGRDDWYCTRTEGVGRGAVSVQESTGAGFAWAALTGQTVPGGSCIDGGWQASDFDGDGTADLLCPHDGAFWLSSGNGFLAQPAAGAFCNAADDQLVGADVNGDGKADLVCNHARTPASDLEVRLATSTGFAAATTWASGWCMGSVTPTDFDGDRRSDLVCNNSASRIAYAGGLRGHPDLLIAADNGYGGRVTVAYAPSTAWANTNNPPIVDTVTETTRSDGRGWSATSRWVYAGGLYDRLERRFLGFRYARTTRPCITDPVTGVVEAQCPSEETWFRQDYGSVSKPERIDQRGGDGVLVESEIHEYTGNGATIPYTSLETGDWKYVYEGGATRRTYVSRTFDSYGNVTAEYTHGDYDLAGDERTVRYLYRPNPAAYIVGQPAVIDTFGGLGSTGPVLAQALYHYDGAASWDAPPSRGLVTQIDAWLDTQQAYLPTRTEYDAAGNVIATIDALGARTSFGYDAAHRRFPTTTTDPLGRTATTTFHELCGAPLRMVDAAGLATTTSYDALCRPVRSDTPDGGWQIHRYVNLGDPERQYEEIERPPASGTTPLWTRSYEDGLGRVYQRTATGAEPGAELILERTTWTARETVASVVADGLAGQAPQLVRTRYDARDRVVASHLPDGAVIRRSYAPGAVTITDPLGRWQTQILDAFGNRVELREPSPDGQRVLVTRFEYDFRKQPRRIVDPAGNTWTSTFDSLGRRIAISDPDLGVVTYAFDAAGREVARVDAMGQRTETSYDLLGRRRTRTTRAGTPGADTTTWSYDEARPGAWNLGRLTSMTDTAGRSTYDHDRGGRRVRTSRSFASTAVEYVTQHGFDEGGRLRWTTFPDGDTSGTPQAPLTYDAAGRLIGIPGVLTGARYDASGRVTQMTLANGVVTSYEYSAQRGALTAIASTWTGNNTGTADTRGTSLIQDLRYTYDLAGRITGVTSPFPGESWTYGYDAADQLTTATNLTVPAASQSFAYDDLGNLVYSSALGAYSYGPAGGPRPHAVRQVGAATYSYDGNGNLLSGGGRTLTWNADNRPLTAGDTSFVYDGEGIRLQKSGPLGTSHYLGDDYEVATASRGGATTTKFFSLGGHLVAQKVGGTMSWLHTDQQGSVRAITDATGQVLQRFGYAPYGSRTATTDLPEVRGYTGQHHDETGLLYLHNRYYDPALGRFLSPDPTVPMDSLIGLNRYAYAQNDPINNTDIDGLGLGSFFKKVAKVLVKPLAIATKVVVTAAKQTVQSGWRVVHGLATGNMREFLSGAIAITATVLSQGISPAAGLWSYIGQHAAVGFGAGFGTALVNGSSLGDSLRAGMVGGAIAAGSAALDRFYRKHTGDADQTTDADTGTPPTHRSSEQVGDHYWRPENNSAIDAFNNVGAHNRIGFGAGTGMQTLMVEGRGISGFIGRIPVLGNYINAVAFPHDCFHISKPFGQHGGLFGYYLPLTTTMAAASLITTGALLAETGLSGAVAGNAGVHDGDDPAAAAQAPLSSTIARARHRRPR